jgi:hypothetical protein
MATLLRKLNLVTEVTAGIGVISRVPVIAVLLSAAMFQPLSAATAPVLGTAASFAVLGSSTVTNTGPTTVTGDVGVSPGVSITGFPPGVVVPPSSLHAGDAVALVARNDANTAYTSAAAQACNTILTGQDLGGLTLIPGVYCFATSAQLTGTLTLDAQGDPSAVFIFKIGSTLTTASNAKVNIINGGAACNVFFQVGSSATLGTATSFMGNIMALASVTINTGVSLSGRAFGLTGAVTLDSNIISIPNCSGSLQVCKVAGTGVAVGTNFTFNVAGNPVIVQAGAAPGGTCSAILAMPAGPVVIVETVLAGTALTGVATLPSAGLLVSSNLGAGTATVNVFAGGKTIVTFTNAAIPVPPGGFVQVCKVAGAGVLVGTTFNFNVSGTLITVQAGPAPLGTCSPPVAVPAGAALIAETIPPGTLLAGVSTLPGAGLLVSSNLATGTATVTVLAGGQTIVTFIDVGIPVVPTNGFLQVCKVAGFGVVVGTNFSFNVAGTPVIIAAGPAPGGTCSAPVTVAAGPATVTETIPAGTVLTGVSTLPSAGLLISSNLATGTANVTVVAGGQTIVTFVDAAIPAPNTGYVQVCKVAGAGIPVGTNFVFSVGGTVVAVPAGPAPGGACGPILTVPAGPVVISETAPPRIVVTGVSTLPSAGLLVSSDLPARTATVTVAAGGQTVVTFINVFLRPDDAFLIRYAANLDFGDSFVNLTNTGVLGGSDSEGTICANAYVFDAAQELIACCACPLTPMHLKTLSAKSDLIGNTLTPGVPTAISVALFASAGGNCNAATVRNIDLVGGLRAWMTTLHAKSTSPTTYTPTETPFSRSLLSDSMLSKMTSYCGFIQANGSGYGICKSCTQGAQSPHQK